LKNKTAMVQAIVQELKLRKDYFDSKEVNTLYFGGGTPSLLSDSELGLLLENIYQHYRIESQAEITIECNPEDLTKEKLNSLFTLGFNRLSIGIQTFNNDILKYTNRAHTATEAYNAVLNAKEKGFENMTLDLMYALPQGTIATLQHDLDMLISLNVPHLSAYCFTLEEKTVFGAWATQKKLLRHGDDWEQKNYLLVQKQLTQNGYEQYEISNFAQNGHYSRHNSSYWLGEHYLGIGPGAHSYNGTERQWNPRNNALYIEKLKQNQLAYESEILGNKEKINELLLVQLRTKWGLNLDTIKSLFGFDFMEKRKKEVDILLNSNLLKLKNNVLFLTEKGKLLADAITVDLML
jgi:oxygen-independent coproporphyrinogen-3 oxidase